MITGYLRIILVLALVSTFMAATAPCHASTANSDSFVAISAGGSFGLALTSSGNVWTWGIYYANNSTITKSTPVQLPISNVTAIAAGFNYGIALKEDGTVWAWGDNEMGQLGDGTTVSSTASLVPVEVKGLAHVIAIATGHLCSYALKDDGTLWAWGADNGGQLGDVSSDNNAVTGNTDYGSVPVMVKGLSNVVAIGNGGPYAIESDGSAWAWGSNVAGQSSNTVVYGSLGDNQSGIRTPFRMENVKTVKAIASGGASYALENNGTLWAWGLESSGVLGNGMELPVGPNNNNIPPCILITQVKINDVVAVSAGSINAITLKSDGTVWVWGAQDQSTGQIYLAPTKADGLDHVIAVSAGDEFNVALKNDGTVWAWGKNNPGGLGTNVPEQILGSGMPLQTITPTINSSIQSATMNTNSAPSQTNGPALQLAGLAGIILIAVIVVYLWMTRKR